MSRESLIRKKGSSFDPNLQAEGQVVRRIRVGLIGGVVEFVFLNEWRSCIFADNAALRGEDVVKATWLLPALFVIVVWKADKCSTVNTLERESQVDKLFQHVASLGVAFHVREEVVISVDKAGVALGEDQVAQDVHRGPLGLLGQVEMSDSHSEPGLVGFVLHVDEHHDLFVGGVVVVLVDTYIANHELLMFDKEGHREGNWVVSVSPVYDVVLGKVGGGEEGTGRLFACLEVAKFNQSDDVGVTFLDKMFDRRRAHIPLGLRHCFFTAGLVNIPSKELKFHWHCVWF